MTLTVHSAPRRLRPAAGLPLWLKGLVSLALMTALAACSSNYNLGISPSLGVALNVALTTASGTTQIYQGQSTVVFATVSNDTSSAGVTWSIIGPGELQDATATQVTYVAPASGVTGAVGAQITATSVANGVDKGTVTIVTFGSPVITPQPIFPANVGIPYEFDAAVQGGTAPFTWSVAAGSAPLPPNLALGASTGAIVPVSGTATTAGTYPFTLEVKDANGAVADQNFTLTVRPATACLLTGQYAFTFYGYRGGAPATHTGVITIDSAGNISGEQDYKDDHRVSLDETLSGTSHCSNRSTNSGWIELDAPSGILSYNFSTTAPDATGVIHSARLQIIGNPGVKTVFTDSGSGEMDLVDTTANTGVAPSGGFAFGLLGVDPGGNHYGTAGSFTASAGALSGGLIDSNGGTGAALGGALTDAPLSGTLSAPDGDGRGTVLLQSGAASSTLVYYIVNANRMFVMNADPTVGSARETGFLTRQSGNVSATTFDNGGLAGPAVLSLWGAQGAINPVTVVSLGQLSGAVPAAGTVNLILDTSDHSTDTPGVTYSGQSYSVGASGRGTLTLTASGGATRSFAFYLDGVSNGYIVEQGSSSGNAGLLEAQTIPAGGFSDVLPGEFVGDTQFPQAPGPVTLTPLMQLSYGSLSSNYTTGSFAIDPTNGRGFGTATVSGVGQSVDVLYIVSPTKVDMMNFATPNGLNGSITWLTQ